MTIIVKISKNYKKFAFFQNSNSLKGEVAFKQLKAHANLMVVVLYSLPQTKAENNTLISHTDNLHKLMVLQQALGHLYQSKKNGKDKEGKEEGDREKERIVGYLKIHRREGVHF